MASNYVFDDVEALIKIIRNLSDKHTDRVWITGVSGKLEAKAPTARKKDAILSVDEHFDPRAFVGNSVTALTSGGGMFLLHLPKELINPELLTVKEESR